MKNSKGSYKFLALAVMAMMVMSSLALYTGAQKPPQGKPDAHEKLPAAVPAEAKPVAAAPEAAVAPVAATEATEAAPTEAEIAEYLKAYGWMVGQQAGFEMGFSDAEVAAIVEGLKLAAKGDAAPENMKEVFPKMQEYLSAKEKVYRDALTAKMNEEAKTHLAEGAKFIAEVATQADVQKSASGLYYKISNPGTGAKPTGEDVVTIHYTGKLIDGTVFDSSIERGQPIDLPLYGVIPGFSEGIQLLAEGGKATLYIPSEIGYGNQAAGPIPPGSTLVFDVELIKVHPKNAEESPEALATPTQE